MPLILPVSAACWMVLQRSVQYSFIQALTSFWTSLAGLKVLSVSGDGMSLYACRAVCWALMKGSSLAELVWYQSFCLDPFLFPKALRAVRRVAFFTFSHCTVEGRLLSSTKAEENCVLNSAKWSECWVLLTSILGFPSCLVQWNFFGWSFNLQHTREWSVSQWALW